MIADVPPSIPVIVFRPDLTGEIKLTAGAFLLNQVSFSIIGSGSQRISINGENASRIFFVSDPGQDLTFSISGLTLTGGFSSANGGAILFRRSLASQGLCRYRMLPQTSAGGFQTKAFWNWIAALSPTIPRPPMAGRSTISLARYHCEAAQSPRTTRSSARGIENAFGGELWVDSSTFSSNRAQSGGGAIDSFEAITSISNTTISGNAADFGGGIYSEKSAVSIWQSTVVRNTALKSVGGILTSATKPVSTTIHNTIVAGNTVLGKPSDLSTNNSSFVNVSQLSSNNLIGDRLSAGGLVHRIKGNILGAGSTNLFRPLADNGGPTATHALLPGSPAINAGNPAFALDAEALPLTTDQRGFPRFSFGTNDIGAFEVAENPISIVSLEATPGVSATMRWTSEAGVSYDVLRSTDLKAWLPIAQGITAVGGLTSWTDNAPPLGRAFYVIRISTAK